MVWHMMAEKDLRKKLREYGLNTQGEKRSLISRIQRYIVLYNSECDNENPRPLSEIIREVEREEKQQSSLTQQRLIVNKKNADPKIVEENNKKYIDSVGRSAEPGSVQYVEIYKYIGRSERRWEVLDCHTSTDMDQDEEKVRVMRQAFQLCDANKSGFIETIKISGILHTIGQVFNESDLQEVIKGVDPDRTGKVNFDQFCQVVSHFLEEDDADALQTELKEAFRLYDKEGNGYITTSVLREILAALDDALKPEDLDGIIAEIDTDGSGTVDFDEFMEMMTGE